MRPISDASAPVLILDHVQKAFGAVHALEDGSLQLFAGEVHGLVGENGAGKSTLVKILAGVHQRDSGSFRIDGNEVRFSNPEHAREASIAVIYQEPTLFPDLSVAENVFIARQPLRRGRRIDTRTMHRRVEELLATLGVRLDPGSSARGLSIADQQIVEIVKALSLNARVIVMDEPTAALSAYEVRRLSGVIETLRAGGAAVLFVSHRLKEEILTICQRVTVMRDGRHIFTRAVDGLTIEELVRAMVGRGIVERDERDRARPGSAVLEVEHLTREGYFSDVSLAVRSGEIVALAGLVGAGRSEVARAVFGIDRYDAGNIRLRGIPLRARSPATSMNSGVAFVPEDRRQQGLIIDSSVSANIAMASLRHLSHVGLIRRASEARFARPWASRLRIKYRRIDQPVSALSGGNQQKVVLAKWLSRQPKLLIVDEPTRGIDVATKSEVQRLLLDSAANGVAILMISSELPEVLRVADRILVMREGRLVAEFEHNGATEELIMAAATGQSGLAALS